MNEWALLMAGLAAGGAGAWLAAASRLRQSERQAAALGAEAAGLREQQRKLEQEIAVLHARLEGEQKGKAAAEASLEAGRTHLEEQRRLLEEARGKLGETFKALSGDVFGSQSHSFLQLAREAFSRLRAESEGDLAKRQEAIEG